MISASNEAVAGFAVWAATYDQTVAKEVEKVLGMPYAEILQRVCDAVAIRPNDRILDVGTGTGALALAIATQLSNGQVVGIDPTREMLRLAEENVRRASLTGRIEFRCAPAEALPFPDASFDAAVSSLALHHTQVRSALREIVRVLRPGGRLAIADTGRNPKWESTLGIFTMPLLFLYYLCSKRSLPIVRAELAAYKQLFVKEEWETMLDEIGLHSVQVREVPHPSSTWSPATLFVLAQK